MIATVFAIALTFTDWDDCMNYVNAHPDLPIDKGFEVCGYADAWVEIESTAPKTSLRPKLRPEYLTSPTP